MNMFVHTLYIPAPPLCAAPFPHPTPVMTEAHPMAKQQPTEPSDDQG